MLRPGKTLAIVIALASVLIGTLLDVPASGLGALVTPTITGVHVVATSVTISFTPVHGDTRYSVRLYRTGALVASSTTCTPSNCRINGLEASTRYSITVAAHGDGVHYIDSPESAPFGFVTTSLAVASAAPQPGWRILVRSPLGVLVDEHTFIVDGVGFVAVRFREATTAFHLHVGTMDPPGAAQITPIDSATRVSANELALGVLAVFNSAFKSSDHAGGSMVDGRVLAPMVPGDATMAITTTGHIVMGVWGSGLPRAGVAAISYRQNLAPLVQGGVPTALASTPYWGDWGAVWHLIPRQPRSGLGVDARGNVLYVATMQGAMPIDLARALAAAGSRFAMQLDINPYWPSLGVTDTTHERVPHFIYELPGEQKDPSVYFSGSTRDFLVAVAEPSQSNCTLASPPPPTPVPHAEPIGFAGAGCSRATG